MTSCRFKLQKGTSSVCVPILQDRPEVTQRQIAQLLVISTSSLNFSLNVLLDKGVNVDAQLQQVYK